MVQMLVNGPTESKVYKLIIHLALPSTNRDGCVYMNHSFRAYNREDSSYQENY